MGRVARVGGGASLLCIACGVGADGGPRHTGTGIAGQVPVPHRSQSRPGTRRNCPIQDKSGLEWATRPYAGLRCQEKKRPSNGFEELSLDFRRLCFHCPGPQESSETGAIAQQQDDPKDGCERARANAAWIHRDVVVQDVHAPAPGLRLPAGHRTGEEQHAPNKLDKEHHTHVVRGRHRGQELDGDRVCWRWLRNEMQKAVESEDSEE